MDHFIIMEAAPSVEAFGDLDSTSLTTRWRSATRISKDQALPHTYLGIGGVSERGPRNRRGEHAPSPRGYLNVAKFFEYSGPDRRGYRNFHSGVHNPASQFTHGGSNMDRCYLPRIVDPYIKAGLPDRDG